MFTHYEPNWGKYVRKTYVHNKDLKVYATGEIYDLRKDPDELKALTRDQLIATDRKTISEFEKVIAQKMK